MFNFTGQPPAVRTLLNPVFTATPSTVSQPRNPFGTSSTSQPFVFGSGAQNTSTISPFGSPPASMGPTNFTFTGFGANQTPSVTPSTNIFGSNLTGTPVKFGSTLAQGTFPAKTTASNIFGSNITTTTTASNRFGTTPFNTSGGLFNQPLSTATTTVPVTTSVFGSNTTANLFSVNPVTTQSSSIFPINIGPSVPFLSGPQPAAGVNIFSPPTTATSAISTAPAITTNIFGVPITTTPNAVPVVSNFTTQPTTAPFSFVSTATSILGTSPSVTTAVSPFNSQLFTGSSALQNPQAVTSSFAITKPQTSTQEQNSQQSASITQQQFLAASLLDPYANRGKTNFTNIDQIQVPTIPAVVSNLSTTTNTTSTPIPVILPIQSNTRKVSPSRSLMDVNFKLKPASSLPTLNDDVKPSITSTGQMKSTLAGNFTDEEELVLLGRTKMSKLRLSNDIINPSHQPDPIRSLYPLRRLADLEKLTNITPPSSSPTTTTTKVIERTSRSSSETRDVSSNHRSNLPITPKQSSSPIIQPKSTNTSQTHRLPILTRDNYYMKPTTSELKSLFNDKGQCILKQFTVGHENYGSVTFYGDINVAGLNLDEIIEIKRHEVIVYPDDNNKPSVREELNLPARITLLDVYPIDRTTREEITDIERIKAANYTDHLRQVTKKFDGEFINYGIQDGSWTFMVKHFTSYGVDENTNSI